MELGGPPKRPTYMKLCDYYLDPAVSFTAVICSSGEETLPGLLRYSRHGDLDPVLGDPVEGELVVVRLGGGLELHVGEHRLEYERDSTHLHEAAVVINDEIGCEHYTFPLIDG